MTHQESVDRFHAIMSQITTERGRQDAKWGEQNHDFPKYYQILNEELGEASKAFLEKDPTNLRVELIQCAAVMVAMLECGDRTGWFEKPIPRDPRSGKDRRHAGSVRRGSGFGRRNRNIGHHPERRGREHGTFVGRRQSLVSDRRRGNRRRVDE